MEVSRAAADGRAILHPHAGAQRFTVDWVAPHPDLASQVANHWTVRWDVGQQPYVAQVLAHPNVMLATELHHLETSHPANRIEVHGVVRGTFQRELHGRGRVHGIKFRAGTFHGLLGADVATLTDRVIPAGQILGDGWVRLAREVIDLDDDHAAAALLDAELQERLPAADPVALQTADLVERVSTDRSLKRADQLARLAGVSVRTLQRTFARHVGVGPKWVVRTYRLQEAAAHLAADDAVDLPLLAAELGYSDQAHLTNDFRRATGRPPSSYATEQARARRQRAD